MKLLFVHSLLLVLITTSFSVHADNDNAEPRAALRGGGSARRALQVNRECRGRSECNHQNIGGGISIGNDCCEGFCCPDNRPICSFVQPSQPRACVRDHFNIVNTATVDLEEDDYNNKFDLNFLSSDHVAVPADIGRLPSLPFRQTKEDPDDDELLFDDELFDDDHVDTSEYISAPWITHCSADSDCNSGINCCNGFCCPTHYPFCVSGLGTDYCHHVPQE